MKNYYLFDSTGTPIKISDEVVPHLLTIEIGKERAHFENKQLIEELKNLTAYLEKYVQCDKAGLQGQSEKKRNVSPGS
jgi:septum formation topological specificity factor MinE